MGANNGENSTAAEVRSPVRASTSFKRKKTSAAEVRGSVQVPTSYTTREIRGVTRAEWDGWLRSSPGGGHVLQSYEWGEFKRRLGWKPVRLVLEKDGEVVGLGQFLTYRTAPIPGVLMYCTKGPWLPWDDGEAARAFFEGVRAIASREGAHTIKIEPEVPEQNKDTKAILGNAGFRKARYDLNLKSTLVVDLSLPEKDLLARMKGKTRYNVRLAARKGVEVVEPEFEESWETFYEWMKATSQRKEDYILRRSRDYLRSVMHAMHDAGQGHLFFAKHGGTPLAGMFVFTFGEKYWYMYGASSDKKRNLKPNYLLQWEVMRWAKRRGLTHYDMVGVPKPEDLDESSSLWNVYKFKEGFGGEIADSLGCFDLAVKRGRAAAWYKFEPVYYRLYYKLNNNVFY
ncbi:MAG TPA: peptidoglycan bridge formation glycyltransferase FemA/FemB family protein [Rubrobacteraceae bacterium]|nr:peptidoglycan bridge formation glycyltransferase FemA/FemB family protein [Rubrobacteraceae bacterium]